MFTGIVQELTRVVAIIREPGMMRLHLGLSSERREGLQFGASVAVNGTCLTVARMDDAGVGFDVIAETLSLTNIGDLDVGDLVNVERSATFSDEIGGHRVSGHVSGSAEVIAIRTSENNRVVRMRGDSDWLRFVFYKGFIALDGASLTVSEFDRAQGWLEVSLIPETLERTTFASRAVGARINVEVDSETVAVVDTVERLLADPEWRERMTTDVQHGSG